MKSARVSKIPFVIFSFPGNYERTSGDQFLRIAERGVLRFQERIGEKMASKKLLVPDAKETLNKYKMETDNEVGVNLNNGNPIYSRFYRRSDGSQNERER